MCKVASITKFIFLQLSSHILFETKLMGQQQTLIKINYFLAAVSFSAVLFAAVFSVGFAGFADFAAGVAAFFPLVVFFFGFAVLAAKICFLRLSKSNLVFTAGVFFGSFTYKYETFSSKSEHIKRVLFSIEK